MAEGAVVPVPGLTEREVAARRARGEGSGGGLATSRSYAQIVRENTVALINLALLAVGLALVALGRYSDALVSAGLVVINAGVGIAQEVRAKRRLDRIALLTRPTATVRREGRERAVAPEALVRGDVLVARPGDQIVVDGQVVEGRMDVDESLLSGESDPMPKGVGDPVAAGSFCVAGRAAYVAEQLGTASLAGTIAAGARVFRRILTPLQREVNLILRVLLLLVAFFGTLLVLASVVNHFALTDAVLAGAVIAGLVPSGLFLMIALAYALSALRLAKLDVLIQQANAIESLSNVDILCLDKTGTLTANRLRLAGVHPLGIGEAELRELLGDYAASTGSGNGTSEAIAAACPGQKRPMREEVLFGSAWKWSALAGGDALGGVTVLGAPEVLGTPIDAAVAEQRAAWMAQGLRVLLVARAAAGGPLHDPAGAPRLPAPLTPLGLLGFADELRPHLRETLDGFAAAGIRLKIISGDSAETVAALAAQAGWAQALPTVSGAELEALDEAQFAQAAEEAAIFGRVTPGQKERLVRALRAGGHYVAMVGDGVNDVLALKQAHLGIAMQSGSAATRSVADMVLLRDSFAALPPAFGEGQRIRNGMEVVLQLFLTRVFAVAALLLAVVVVGAGFPFTPKSISLLSTLTVGIPAFALAAWARPGAGPKQRLVRSLVHFVVPASQTLAMAALGVYLAYFLRARDAGPLPPLSPTATGAAMAATNLAAQAVARDALTVATVLGGLLLIPFARPPTRFWVGGNPRSGDWRPTLLALGLLGAYAAILAVPPARGFFGLGLLGAWDYAGIGGVMVAWALALRTAWRARLLDRFLGVPLA